MYQQPPSNVPSQQEKCPKHQQNDIILMCLGNSCLEPLCKECCKTHVTWHNEMGTKIELDTIDNLKTNCLEEIQRLKVRFQQERAVLHHFKDEGDGFLKSIHNKLEKIKSNLQKILDEYLLKLEQQIAEKIKLHRESHPSENRILIERLDKCIISLETQERSLMGPKQMRGLLNVINEEKNHDFDKLQFEVDTAIKSYLRGMFDITVHENHLEDLKSSLRMYVAVEPATLEDEIEHYVTKVRDGKKVYGIDQQNPYLQEYRNQPSQSSPVRSQIFSSGNRAQFTTPNTLDNKFKQDIQRSRNYKL